jgi:hypothetical protein
VLTNNDVSLRAAAAATGVWHAPAMPSSREQEIIKASRGNKSDFEVAAEIIGGGNGRKASGADIAKAILAGPPQA